MKLPKFNNFNNKNRIFSTCIAVKSLGSLIGGQLISSKVGLNTPQLFRYTAIVTSTLGLAYFGLYYMFAKRAEVELIDKLDKQYPGERMTSKQSSADQGI